MVDPVIIQITKRLRQIARALSKHSKFILEHHKITVPQLICLREIYEHGPIALSALSKIVLLNKSTVTGIVDRLEKSGLVRRTRISSDRRQIHVEITEKGSVFIQEAPTPMHDHFVQQVQALDKEEVQSLLSALEKIARLLGVEDEPSLIDPPKSAVM